MGAERLGRYTILKHLASGGMADVLLARTEGIEGFARHVVVKRIRAEHAKDERFIQMFLDEARLAAGLHHQNIVQVNDIGEANGDYFFAMEYLHGEDLRKILSAVSKSKMHMPLGYVVAIVASVASGLHHAHERRTPDGTALDIVHRDVSPSNILVGYDGAVKIVDFGIAKAAMRQVETKSGSLKGKVSYMSPEQCKGDSIDRRSDVYALGVVLYELSTTTRLFKGDNEYLLMDAIVNGKIPPPKSRRSDLPNELAMIIMRAVSTEPTKRFQNAEELRIALEQFAIKSGLTASTSALATYMNKLFGAKPEPWLEKDSTSVDTRPMGEAGTGSGSHGQVHNSWTEIPRDAIEEEAAQHEAKTTTDGKRRLSKSKPMPIVTPAAFEDTNVPAIAARETRTSNKFGFEQVADKPATGQSPAAPTSSNTFAKAVMIGLPMIAVAGVATWHFALRDTGSSNTTTTPAPTTPAPVAAVQTAPAPVAAPAAPSKVEVTLDADNASARVVFRRRISPAPFKTELTPSDIVELVEVSAPGFKTERYWLTFDRETHLKAHMVKGSGIEEATEEQTLVALGEAAASEPAAPAPADSGKPTPGAPAPVVAARAPTPTPVAPRRKVGVKAAEEAPAVADAKPAAQIEQAAAVMNAPLPVAPPEPTPAPVVAPPKPAPPPPPAPVKAEPARAVPPATFKTMLISSHEIAVPDATLTQMARDEKKKLATVIKVCIDPSGNVTSTSVIKSSGYSIYDDKLVEGIRSWKYRGYVDGGKAVPACSAVAISFSR
jgi:TonB family protein